MPILSELLLLFLLKGRCIFLLSILGEVHVVVPSNPFLSVLYTICSDHLIHFILIF